MKNLFVKITGSISILIFLFLYWGFTTFGKGPIGPVIAHRTILYLSAVPFLVIILIHLGISFLRVKSLDKIDKIIFGINLLIMIIILYFITSWDW